MSIRRTDLKTEAGVKLTLVEKVTPLGTVRSRHYRLTTPPQTQARVLPQRDLADDTFDLEVIASLLDPLVHQKSIRP
jgi:hypothetical protein